MCIDVEVFNGMKWHLMLNWIGICSASMGTEVVVSVEWNVIQCQGRADGVIRE
jgi:hypothetical protein